MVFIYIYAFVANTMLIAIAAVLWFALYFAVEKITNTMIEVPPPPFLVPFKSFFVYAFLYYNRMQWNREM